jgi:predicted nucleic acid-binding protein
VPFVLDASIAASWHFEDEFSPHTDAVLNSLRHETAIVPAQWWFEIRNVLLQGERRGRASEQQTARFLDRLAVLPIALAGIPDEGSTMALARRHRLTFYDAAYLELAQREGIALATLDGDLATAARAEGVALIAAAP